MKQLLSTGYKEWAFNVALFLLRVGTGLLMLSYGYQKLIHFAEKKDSFMNFMGIGSMPTLLLVIFAEVFCSILLIAGLFSRFAALVLTIQMAVIVFKLDGGDIFGQAEKATLFLLAFATVLLVGPGKYSSDAALGR